LSSINSYGRNSSFKLSSDFKTVNFWNWILPGFAPMKTNYPSTSSYQEKYIKRMQSHQYQYERPATKNYSAGINGHS
jgi:hypothetical protein